MDTDNVYYVAKKIAKKLYWSQSVQDPLASSMEDYASELYLKAVEVQRTDRWSKLDSDKDLYAFMAMHNHAKNIKRARYNKFKYGIHEEFLDDLPSTSWDIDRRIDARRVIDLIKRELPDDDWKDLVDSCGGSMRDKASESGLSYSAYAVRIHRLRKKAKNIVKNKKDKCYI